MVRQRGLEPPRGFPHNALNVARLPVPPLPRLFGTAVMYPKAVTEATAATTIVLDRKGGAALALRRGVRTL